MTIIHDIPSLPLKEFLLTDYQLVCLLHASFLPEAQPNNANVRTSNPQLHLIKSALGKGININLVELNNQLMKIYFSKLVENSPKTGSVPSTKKLGTIIEALSKRLKEQSEPIDSNGLHMGALKTLLLSLNNQDKKLEKIQILYARLNIKFYIYSHLNELQKLSKLDLEEKIKNIMNLFPQWLINPTDQDLQFRIDQILALEKWIDEIESNSALQDAPLRFSYSADLLPSMQFLYFRLLQEKQCTVDQAKISLACDFYREDGLPDALQVEAHKFVDERQRNLLFQTLCPEHESLTSIKEPESGKVLLSAQNAIANYLNKRKYQFLSDIKPQEVDFVKTTIAAKALSAIQATLQSKISTEALKARLSDLMVVNNWDSRNNKRWKNQLSEILEGACKELSSLEKITQNAVKNINLEEHNKTRLINLVKNKFLNFSLNENDESKNRFVSLMMYLYSFMIDLDRQQKKLSEQQVIEALNLFRTADNSAFNVRIDSVLAQIKRCYSSMDLRKKSEAPAVQAVTMDNDQREKCLAIFSLLLSKNLMGENNLTWAEHKALADMLLNHKSLEDFVREVLNLPGQKEGQKYRGSFAYLLRYSNTLPDLLKKARDAVLLKEDSNVSLKQLMQMPETAPSAPMLDQPLRASRMCDAVILPLDQEPSESVPLGVPLGMEVDLNNLPVGSACHLFNRNPDSYCDQDDQVKYAPK